MTTSAYDVIRRITIDRLEEDGLDPLTDRDEITTAVAGAVHGYQEKALGTADRPSLVDPDGMVRRVVASIIAFGPLTDLLDARDVEEVFIEGDRVTFVDGRGRLRSLLDPVTAAETMHLIARLLAPTDRRLDTSSPIVQARVLEGTARLTAVIPPVSDRLSATIRRYALRRDSLSHMVELGSLSEPAAAFLRAVMQTTSSILVSGPPGAGKTSLLAALLTAVPGDHCVRCIEEVRELSINLSPNSSFYEARPPGVDGAASVTMRNLVKLVLATCSF